MKWVMSGRKFAQLMRHLHVCSMDVPSVENYDPSYKVSEFRDYLQQRFIRLFEPGRQLSLDETLIRSFGRIKFKVRIVSKAARYGIKIYVLTDAATAFVLKVIIYTGKHTYNETESAHAKKMVNVVRELCREVAGTHRTIYIDHFYTSLELLKELRKMNLYVTGTIMRNCIPKELTIPSTTSAFKEMQRGGFKLHLYTYKEGERVEIVCWKDCNIVYCMSNESGTVEHDTCQQRSREGLLTLKRPKLISEYNRYMGGVDVADMQRLHCNSAIMGQKR